MKCPDCGTELPDWLQEHEPYECIEALKADNKRLQHEVDDLRAYGEQRDRQIRLALRVLGGRQAQARIAALMGQASDPNWGRDFHEDMR